MIFNIGQFPLTWVSCLLNPRVRSGSYWRSCSIKRWAARELVRRGGVVCSQSWGEHTKFLPLNSSWLSGTFAQQRECELAGYHQAALNRQNNCSVQLFGTLKPRYGDVCWVWTSCDKTTHRPTVHPDNLLPMNLCRCGTYTSSLNITILPSIWSSNTFLYDTRT